MSELYRVFMKGDRPTVFKEENDKRFRCTHGGWVGELIDLYGKPALKHAYGTAVYESYTDLTKEQIDEKFGEGYV